MGERGASDVNLSLSEVHGSVEVPHGRNMLRRLLAMSGPAYLVSVGYMDPGNWATDLAAGSQFNHTLLWVLLMSNLMAVLLQSLAARLGVVRGLDLAQACRTEYPSGVNLALYGLCEVAIAACDLAEVLGSAIALKLLFGLPLIWGVLITAADTFALLFLSQFGIRKMEAVVISLITVVAGAFFVEIVLARPDWSGVFSGFVPSLPSPTALFVAMGMLGATVMPHNLYLHSSLVQTRRIGDDAARKRQALRLNTLDSFVALNMAFFVNAAILIMAASVFFRTGNRAVGSIQDAHALLEPILGAAVAPVAFAIALLASGQSSTITGTLAGQIVMEGFLNFRVPPWVRRLITRLLAIIPAAATILWVGEGGTVSLLVLSQVVLSMQLPFAIIPLIHFVSDRQAMGEFAAGRTVRVLAWATAAIVVGLNGWLVWDTVRGWAVNAGAAAGWVYLATIPVGAAVALLLLYVTVKPWLERMLLGRRPAPGVGIHEPEGGSLGLPAVGEPAPCGRVAVALDFSGRDSEILSETLRFLGGQRPELALMHVVESASARFLGKESADVETQRDMGRLSSYAEQLGRMGYTVNIYLGTGKPVPELVRMIGEFGPDLVVLGAHGHRFLSDLLFGSTADALRHRIAASVLVIAKKK